jgi:hypothetical protein
MLKIIFKNKKNIILIYFKIKKYFEKKPLLHSQTFLFSNILLQYWIMQLILICLNF